MANKLTHSHVAQHFRVNCRSYPAKLVEVDISMKESQRRKREKERNKEREREMYLLVNFEHEAGHWDKNAPRFLRQKIE